MADAEIGAWRDAAGRLAAGAWEARRRLYARGLLNPKRVAARVVSIGNLTLGGTGKTTLTIHLAAVARGRGLETAVVCRRYRPGPAGRGDEELLYRNSFGESTVYAGRSKRDLAERAARAGARLVLVDDGFSHWALERDLDIVLLDRHDPWGGGRMFPAGRLREPRRALQRAACVVISRLGPAEDPSPWIAEARRVAPAARFGAGRHQISRFRLRSGMTVEAPRRVRVVSATGNPQAVAASAAEAGLEVCAVSAYRDHHWFRAVEVREEAARAVRERADLLLSAKDAVRWPEGESAARVVVMEVAWRWVCGGQEIERRVMEGGEA